MTRRATLQLQPRLLDEERAAAYCSLGVTAFKRECPVIPIKIGSAVRYDRQDLDQWIDGKTGKTAELDPAHWLGKLDDADANKGH